MMHRPEHLPPGTGEDMASRVVTPEPQDVPPTAAPLVPLPPRHLACGTCGVAVPLGGEVTDVEVTDVVGRPKLPPFRDGTPQVLLRVSLSVCADCLAHRARARSLVDDSNPRALMRAGVAGDALAVIGRPVPERLSASALAALLHHLGDADVAWASRFLDRVEDPQDAGRCSPTPWAHVPETTRTALRRAYMAHLDQRRAQSAPPVYLGPPSADGGCLMCGVAGVEISPVDVIARGGLEKARQALWRPISADARVLGGPPSPVPLSGHLCPSCARARNEAGSTGLRACERALRAHLLATGRSEEAQRVREGETYGLVAWGALRDRPQPGEAWGHVTINLTEEVEMPEWEPVAVERPRAATVRRTAPRAAPVKAKAKAVAPAKPAAPRTGYVASMRF